MKLPQSLAISDYNYDLPQERIAIYPVPRRDASRLLTYADGKIQHHVFRDLPDLLPGNSLLAANDSKVMWARVKLADKLELLLLSPYPDTTLPQLSLQSRHKVIWKCLVGGKRHWKDGQQLSKSGVTLAWFNRSHDLVEFRWHANDTFAEVLDRIAVVPLPPYLHRDSDASDKVRYQTVYARQEGSVAAPTAGLHFTTNLLKAIKRQGITIENVTLHVGIGTFRPVEVANALKHDMHSEVVIFSRKLIGSLASSTGPIVAVGTTTLRSLESLYWYGLQRMQNPELQFEIDTFSSYQYSKSDLLPRQQVFAALAKSMQGQHQDFIRGETKIMIVPGYDFQVCDYLITNFHQPQSTLLLLIAAFAGDDWKRIYAEALARDYRFLSYGDSSLLQKKN